MYGAACEKMLMAQNESLGIVFKMKGNLRIEYTIAGKYESYFAAVC